MSPEPGSDQEIEGILSDLDGILSSLTMQEAESLSKPTPTSPAPKPLPASLLKPAAAPVIKPAVAVPVPAAKPALPAMKAPLPKTRPQSVAPAPAPAPASASVPVQAPISKPPAPAVSPGIELAPRAGILTPKPSEKIEAPAPKPASKLPTPGEVVLKITTPPLAAKAPEPLPMKPPEPAPVQALKPAPAPPPAPAPVPVKAPEPLLVVEISEPKPEPKPEPKTELAASAPNVDFKFDPDPIPENTPKEQIRRIAFLYSAEQAASAEKLMLFLGNVAGTVSKKPLYLHKSVVAVVRPTSKATELLTALKKTGTVGAVVLLEGLSDDQVKDLEGLCGDEDIFFRKIASADVGKRMAAIELLLELMLLRAG